MRKLIALLLLVIACKKEDSASKITTPAPPTPDEARAFVAKANAELLAKWSASQLADWNRETDIAPATQTLELAPVPPFALPEPLPFGETRRLPLGLIAGARSGDKGGSANVGLWVRTEDHWRWLAHTLTVEKLRELLPETADLPVTRHLFPNLWAVNFVIDGILGQGVAYQARFDPQAKGLGEWLRSRHIEIPEELLG